MRFDIISIFPEFFAGPLDYGIVRRAREARLIEAQVHDLRAFTHDRHRTVDDRPFGGGEGMVMKPEPLFDAVESLFDCSDRGRQSAIVLLSAAGKLFRQETARRFAQLERMVLICGRYEGVDERVAEHLATDEISIGDFVLSGGELPAAMILDAVTRLIPGALGNEDSAVNESFSAGDVGAAWGAASRAPTRCPCERARDFGLSALHAAAVVSRMGCAGSAGGRQPRRDSPLAPATSAGENSSQSSRFAVTRGMRKPILLVASAALAIAGVYRLLRAPFNWTHIDSADDLGALLVTVAAILCLLAFRKSSPPDN